MSVAAKEILEAALKLEPIERARLADTIWQSLGEAEIEKIEEAEDVGRAEAVLARMKENREEPVAWEDVKKRLALG
jgi:putative addiction module component (TIGR02574 family)